MDNKKKHLLHPHLKVKKEIPEKEDLSQKSSELMICTKRSADEWGGYIYTFVMKKTIKEKSPPHSLKIQGIEEKLIDQVYDHFSPNQLAAIETKEEEKIIKTVMKAELQTIVIYAELIKKLGYETSYSKEELTLLFPDKLALIGRWNKIRKSDPKLPPIDILCYKSFVDDMAFIEAYFTHRSLLSSSNQFVYDHFSSVLPMIAQQISFDQKTSSESRNKNAKLIKILAKEYEKVETLENDILKGIKKIDNVESVKVQIQRLKSSVHLFANSLKNFEVEKEIGKAFEEEFQNNIFNILWQEDAWNKYWKTKSSNQNVKIPTLVEIWNEIQAVIKVLQKNDS